MNREELTAFFENMTPDEEQKERMKANIMIGKSSASSAGRFTKRFRARWIVPAIGLAAALVVLLTISFGGKTTAYAIDVRVGSDGPKFRLADHGKSSDEFGTTVSYVDSRPGLEFYINGDNIAKIEISTKNEYIYAVDWTKTQDEKYWNSEVYQTFDEERQVAIADFSLLYDKKLTMNFDEQFTDYDQIWYRWTAWEMHQWASQDNFSHFLGAGQVPDDLNSQEALSLAAGDDGSGIGHMQLDEYPDELKKDRITIVITDREGRRTTKVINVKVSNNELRQTVLTASLEN